MRLIDADALLKIFGFTEDCTNCKHRYNDMLCESVIWRDVCDAIFEAPTIDAVSVVRCKDCKWFDKQRCVCHNPRYGDGYANYQPPNTNDEYWCADGERKDDE